MIVWGGNVSGVGTDLNTGGRYVPTTDLWLPTAVEVTTPAARRDHAAVWTGNEMIVWGGQTDNTSFPVTGGRYDPAADHWSLTQPNDRASGIGTAVWTGSEMIAWNGWSGGRYCACASTFFYRDADGDGTGDARMALQACSPPAGYLAFAGDCDDADPGVWRTPGEAHDFMFTDDTTCTWSAPPDPGALILTYDLLRSANAADFVGSATCVTSDVAGLTATDPTSPSSGSSFFYLVRAENDCPNGMGALGTSSGGMPRTGRLCP
jgi:hypothetical protein